MIGRAATIVLAVLGLVAGMPAFAGAAARIGFEPVPGSQVPLTVRLRDETGREQPLSQWIAGKAVILVPVYFTCPNLCDLTVAGLSASVPNDDTSVLLLSIDPAETSESLRNARRKLNAGAHGSTVHDWRLLRGDAAAIEQVTTAIGFRYFYDPRRRQFAHAAGFVVLDRSGRIASSFMGVRYQPSRIRAAVEAAARGEVGALGQRLLLTCFDYDPASGSYSLRIVKLVRLFGLIGAAGLLGGVAWAVWRERTVRRAGLNGEGR